MFDRLKALALALFAPILLVGCAFSPGKFVSTLTILADRSFTYSYKGEVLAIDIAGAMTKGLGDSSDDDASDDGKKDASFINTSLSGGSDDNEDDAAKHRAIAEALTKEAGYRSVVYKGDGVFDVDYEISGRLSHAFMWPYNLDAEVLFPFIAVELRGADIVRVKAPGFAGNDKSKESGADNDKLDGTFTLITDAELVSQNNEDGATTNGNRRSISWKATPLKKDPPMAVIRLNPRS